MLEGADKIDGRNAYGPTGGDLAAIAIPIVVPLLVLAVPLLDVLLAIIRRMRHGLGIHHADKQHIHHRLLEIGHTHRQAVFLMYLWSALISGCALAVAFINGRALVGGIVALAALLAAVLPRLVRDRAPRGSDRAPSGSDLDLRMSEARVGLASERAEEPGPPATRSTQMKDSA